MGFRDDAMAPGQDHDVVVITARYVDLAFDVSRGRDLVAKTLRAAG